MKVFFGSSTAKIEKHYPTYKLICDTIVKSGNELTRDWLEQARENVEKDVPLNFEELYEEIISSILDANVCIVEGTVKGLSTGHVMTVAIQRGKPLLYLHKNLNDDKFPFMVTEEESELLTERTYDDLKEIPQIVNDFLESQKKGKKVRFNLVLSQPENNYLEWAMFMYKKTKTDILRELIADRIHIDINYQRSHSNGTSKN